MTSSSNPTASLDLSENINSSNNNNDDKTINNNINNASCETDKDDILVEHENDKQEKKVLPREEETDSKADKNNEDNAEVKTQVSAEITSTVTEEEPSKSSKDRQPSEVSEEKASSGLRQAVEKTSKKVTAKRRSFSKTSATSSDLDSNRKDSSSGEFKFLPDGKNKLELVDSSYGAGVIKQKSTKHLDTSASSKLFHAGVDYPASRFVTSCSHSRKKTNQSLECRNSETSHFMACKCHLQRVNGRSKTCWQKLVPCSESTKLAHPTGMERAESGEDDCDDDEDDDDERNEDEDGRSGQDQQQYVVNVHVNPGETFSVCVSDQVQLIQGPATVRMVSNGGPPLPMPMQVPPGHMVQQIIDENGILTNVILSSQPPGLPTPPVVVGYYGNPSGSPHHHHVYPPFGAHYPAYPSQYPVHHHHMHHHLGQPRMCTTSPSTLHHCNHPATQPPSLSHNPILNGPHFYPPNVLPPPPSHHHHHHHQFSSNHLEERFTGRAFKSRPPSSRSFVKFKDNNLIRSDHHHHPHPFYFPAPPHPLPPPPHLHPPPHRLPIPPYLRGAVPLKVSSNGRPRSLSTSSEDQELEEERQATIKEGLSRITPPKVVEVGARYALILLTPPDFSQQEIEIDLSDYIYELHLSEKDETGFNSVYSGDATEITLRDLKAATVYFIKVMVTLDNVSGTHSDSVSFTTTSCEPDSPQAPKLVSRTVSTLTLKWNAAVENGSVITGYTLEYDGGKGDMSFSEVYNGNQRQFKLNDLSPATSYTFRLAAYNALGKSEFSRLICHSTSGTAPTQPDPPMLSDSFSTSLTISWIRRPNDDHFTLMMADANEETKNFSTVYGGSGLSFNVQNLYRNSEYKFKLQASNEEGTSEWSDVVKYKTLPDKPAPCASARLEGEATADSFTVSWDPPSDDGGQEVTHYLIQLDNGKNQFVKKCIDRRYTATELKPGLVHSVRVAAVNSIGSSDWGEELKIKTKCVVPGMCCQPKLTGKPQGNNTSIKWTCPEETGGCKITRYEVSMEDVEENITSEVYAGPDDSCTVTSMTPGRKYFFKVRAVNDVGSGPWSESLEVASGALPPDAPNPPSVNCTSPYQATVSWEEPLSNGAPITEYRLEWQQLESEFSQLYVGSNLSAQVDGMLAASLYNFRVQAMNSVGCGPFSPATPCLTPPSHPGPVTCIHASSTSNSIRLSWKEPVDNGRSITGYYLGIDERAVVPLDIGNGLEHLIENLTPETVYKIRLQAVNSIGLGPFSSTLKIATHSPPPPPPLLECVATTYNSLKLKWRDSKTRLDSGVCGNGSSSSSTTNGQRSYCLEMLRDGGEFHTLYYGPGHCFKVTKLSELSEYQFRICSSNQDGRGPFSEVFKFTTSKAPPPVIKSPKVAYITSEACTVEWPGLRSMGQDNMFYILQMQSAFGRDQTFKEIYRGPSTSYRVSGLLPSGEYRLKVCAVRQSKDSTNQELVGSFSQTTSFVTLAPKSSGLASSESVKLSTKSSSESGSSGLGLTDQQWAIALLICFTLFAILVACLAQHFISRHQQQHSGLGGESVMSSGSDPSIPSPITSTSEKRN